MNTFKHDVRILWRDVCNLPNGMHVDHIGNVLYVYDGALHREDGPAANWAIGVVDWWINGKRYSDIDAWGKKLGIFDSEEFVILKLEYG